MMCSEIASTSAVHVWANDHRTMNRRALTEWINSSSICDSENLSWLEHPLCIKNNTVCHLLLVEVLVTSNGHRPCGWVSVTSLSAPLTTTLCASPRPPGWDGRWVRLRNTLYGCDPPYWLTHLLLFAFIETVLCCGHLVLRTPFRLSSLVWFWAKSFWNLRYS